jgi:tRNA-uridine 2-sulfurtransferase
MSIKAVGLLSGGLDSTLAARILLDQGIEVHAINFTSPFCTCTAKGASCASVVTAVRQLGNIPLERVAMGDDYLEMIRNPKHGYGRGMNPCIDCRIMKIGLAGKYMESIGGSFLFTGEVIGQRPMSQTRNAINIIDKYCGYRELLLRPLSAQFFEPTLPEQKGWVDRKKLLDFNGRNRKPQIELAAQMGIADYPCPAGGCRLTETNFAERLRDYFDHAKTVSVCDMPLLKIGRHFRLDNGDKAVLARDEAEGEALIRLARDTDHLLIPQFPGPVAILQGTDVDQVLDKMVEYTKSVKADVDDVEHRFKGMTEMLRVSFNKNG